MFNFRYHSPEHFVQIFRDFYGPTLKAFAALDASGQKKLEEAILALLEECHVPVYEYKPAQVKLLLTGYGKADKHQIARMLAAQVKLPDGKLDDHARDAIAIAVCHARSRRFGNGYRA